MKTSERCERHFFALITFHKEVLKAAPPLLKRIIKALEVIVPDKDSYVEDEGKAKAVQTFNVPIKEDNFATERPKTGQSEKEDPPKQMNVLHKPDEWTVTDEDQTSECTSGSQESMQPGLSFLSPAAASRQHSCGYFPRGNLRQNYYIDNSVQDPLDADFWIQMKERWEC